MRASLSASKTHVGFGDFTQDIVWEDVIKNAPHRLGLYSETELINLILTRFSTEFLSQLKRMIFVSHRSRDTV